MLTQNEHDELLTFLDQRGAPQRFIMLPKEGELLAYALSDGELTATGSLNAVVGRRPDDTQPGACNPVVMSGHQSVSGERGAILHRTSLTGHVAIHDLRTATHLGDIPVPGGAQPMAVLLLGDFVFVSGDGLGIFWLGGDQEGWRVVTVPPEICKPIKGIDFLGISGDHLWAIDDVVYPLYAAAYDLRDSRFDERPATFEFAEQVNPRLCDFDCNDQFLVTLVESRSGWAGTSHHLTISGRDFNDRVAWLSTEPERGSIDPRAPRKVALLGNTLFAACGPGGLAVADLGETTGEFSWSRLIPFNGIVVDVVCCADPARVFAIVESASGRGVSWRELSLQTWQFL